VNSQTLTSREHVFKANMHCNHREINCLDPESVKFILKPLKNLRGNRVVLYFVINSIVFMYMLDAMTWIFVRVLRWQP
jgi:hypothetical protein